MRARALACVLAASCAGSPARQGNPHAQRRVPLDAAELPHKLLRADGGEEVAPEIFFEELAGAQVVCLAEHHPNPHHHWAQLFVWRELVGRAGAAHWALGLEMFQRPFQGVLDDYAAGRIDTAQLLERTAWDERWGFDFDLYRPMIELAVERKLRLLALNAPSELVKKVAHHGLESLGPDERARLPPLDLGDERHRAYFREATEGHGQGMEERFEDFYAAQVIWDETMADTAATWIAGGERRRVAILAGTGHCHPTAIPFRAARRGLRVLSVLPVIEDGEGRVARALASPASDYLLVLDATAAR